MVIPSRRTRRDYHAARTGGHVKHGIRSRYDKATRINDKEFFYSEKDLNSAFRRYYKTHTTEYLGFKHIWDRSPALTKRNSLEGVTRKIREYASQNVNRFKVQVQLSFRLYKPNDETTNGNNKNL